MQIGFARKVSSEKLKMTTIPFCIIIRFTKNEAVTKMPLLHKGNKYNETILTTYNGGVEGLLMPWMILFQQ